MALSKINNMTYSKKLRSRKGSSKLAIVAVSLVMAGVSLYVARTSLMRSNISLNNPEGADAYTAACTLSLTRTPPTLPPTCGNLDIALVIDRSSTMTQLEPDGRKKLDWARDAAKTFVSAIKNSGNTHVRVMVDSFGAQGNDGTGILASTYNSSLDIPLTNVSTGYSSIISALDRVIYSKPGTCVQCGIRIANRSLLLNTANRRVEVLFSDGMANHTWEGLDTREVPAGSPNPKQLAITAANNGRGVGHQFRVIGYGPREAGKLDEATLISIAGSAANYHWQPNAASWSAEFLTILNELCTQ
jgi:hypothetical protein